MEYVSGVGGLARHIDLELAQVERNARYVGHCEHAGVHLVLVRRTFYHEANVLVCFGHCYYRRLPSLVDYENILGEVGVLRGELGNLIPLVLVGVGRACPESGVVGGEDFDVVGVVVPVGVTPLVLEAERACRLAELHLQEMVARVGVYPARKSSQFCHPRVHGSGSQSHVRVPDGVENRIHVIVYQVGVVRPVGRCVTVRDNLRGIAQLGFPDDVSVSRQLFLRPGVGMQRTQPCPYCHQAKEHHQFSFFHKILFLNGFLWFYYRLANGYKGPHGFHVLDCRIQVFYKRMDFFRFSQQTG